MKLLVGRVEGVLGARKTCELDGEPTFPLVFGAKKLLLGERGDPPAVGAPNDCLLVGALPDGTKRLTGLAPAWLVGALNCAKAEQIKRAKHKALCITKC